MRPNCWQCARSGWHCVSLTRSIRSGMDVVAATPGAGSKVDLRGSDTSPAAQLATPAALTGSSSSPSLHSRYTTASTVIRFDPPPFRGLAEIFAQRSPKPLLAKLAGLAYEWCEEMSNICNHSLTPPSGCARSCAAAAFSSPWPRSKERHRKEKEKSRKEGHSCQRATDGRAGLSDGTAAGHSPLGVPLFSAPALQ